LVHLAGKRSSWRNAGCKQERLVAGCQIKPRLLGGIASLNRNFGFRTPKATIFRAVFSSSIFWDRYLRTAVALNRVTTAYSVTWWL